MAYRSILHHENQPPVPMLNSKNAHTKNVIMLDNVARLMTLHAIVQHLQRFLHERRDAHKIYDTWTASLV